MVRRTAAALAALALLLVLAVPVLAGGWADSKEIMRVVRWVP